jgi:RecA-family ATPase
MPYDTVKSLLAWTPPDRQDIISKGILPPGGRMVIFGGPKTWKSQLAMHTAFCIASGVNWLGFSTRKCVVLKVQTELPKGEERARIDKYSMSLAMSGRAEIAFPANLFLETEVFLKLDTAIGLSSLEKEVDEISKKFKEWHMVLILDPLYKMLSGNINDNYALQKFLDNMDFMLGRHPRMSVVIVHHSHKPRYSDAGQLIDEGADASTGGRYLQNWCDTMATCQLLNPKTGKNKVRMDFALVRCAEEQLPLLDIKWSRATLLPEVVKSVQAEEVEDEEFVPDIRS